MLISWYQTRLAIRFRDKVNCIIENDEKGKFDLHFDIDKHNVSVTVDIDEIVFVESVSVTDRKGERSELDEKCMFDWFRYQAINRLTDRLILRNAMNAERAGVSPK